MSNVKRIVGFIWASPLTVFALCYVLLFQLISYYDYQGVHGDAFVWRVNTGNSPVWLNSLWKSWGGHAVGNVVVLRNDLLDSRTQVTLRHEQEHVRQCMILGVFQPILYGLSWLSIKLACKNSDPYYSNVFELDARRAAGQIVDVEGVAKKLALAQNKRPI